MRKRLKNSLVFQNISWLLMGRAAQSVLALVVSMLSARYLGPSNFGIINYAASVVAFAMPITQLGLDQTLVQELVARPDREGEILGTSILMSMLSALACIVGVVTFARLSTRHDTTTILVCGLYSLLLIFYATEMLCRWFQAKYLSKYVSVVTLCAYVTVSAYKLYLLASGKSIYWFAVSNALDYLLISAALLVIYRRLSSQKLRFSATLGRELLHRSRYYIVYGLLTVVYSQTDRIMLRLMIDSTETGYYSAAVGCVTLVSFVFTAIIDSMRPYALSVRETDYAEYEKRVTRLYSAVVWPAILYAVVCTVLPGVLVSVLYGGEYAPAIPILRAAACMGVFSYFGGAQGVWMLAEGKQKYLILLGGVGAACNVALNAILIPVLQARGAAIATVATQLLANVVLVLFIPALRPSLRLLGRALRPSELTKLIRGK